jgi:hypothetical protein
MTPAERRQEWMRYLEFSQPLNGLLAILENDGEKMLSEILKELGLASALDLVKWAKDKGA